MMITNLAPVFSDKTNNSTSNNEVEQFLSNLRVQVLGHGERGDNLSPDARENFMCPAFLLISYEQGSVTLEHSGKTTVLSPGSFYIFNPFELFSGRRTSKESLCYKYIYFDITPISSRSIFRKLAFTGDDTYFQQEWYHTVGADLLKHAFDSSPGHNRRENVLLQYAVRGIVAYIIYTHFKQMPTGRRLNTNKSTVLIDQSFSYTSRHLSHPINISRMVRALGTSRSTIDRVFLDVMQMTPSQALTRYKIQISLGLLQAGKSVKEVSQELGYSSTFHFSNTFKIIFGKSPRKYLGSV